MESTKLSPYFGTPILTWSAPEHDTFELGPKSRVIVTFLLLAIIAWALYTNSPLMAITFILVGITGYLLSVRPPRSFRFAITTKGVLAHNEFYDFEDLESFFIHEDPPFENLLSLRTTGKLTPHVHVPLSTLSHAEVRLHLRTVLPEEVHDLSFVDTLEKFLHI